MTRTSLSTASTASRTPLGAMSPSDPPTAARTSETIRRHAQSTRCAPNSPSYASASRAPRTQLANHVRGLARRPGRGRAHRGRGKRANHRTSAANARPVPQPHRRSHGARLRTRAPQGRRTAKSEGDRTQPPTLPTTPPAEPSMRPYVSAPPSSKLSSPSSASSTCVTRCSTTRHTSPRRSGRSPSSRAHDAPGSKPRDGSRPTASTTPSPTQTTPLDHPPPRAPRAHTGSAQHKTSTELSANSAAMSTVVTGTNFECPKAARAIEALRPDRTAYPSRRRDRDRTLRRSTAASGGDGADRPGQREGRSDRQSRSASYLRTWEGCCTSLRYRTSFAAGSSAGRWPTTCGPSSSRMRCRWRSRSAALGPA